MINERGIAAEHSVDVSGDSAFQRRARLLQALWREDHDYPIGRFEGTNPMTKAHVSYELGSRMKMPDAEMKLWNFLTPEIGALARAEVDANTGKSSAERKLFGEPRFFEDLLSSQPMCFNLFGALKLGPSLDLATRVFRSLWPDRVERVTRIEFEHSPGRGDSRYLDNRSAADAYVEHTTPDGGRGIIGIETKYHENLAVENSDHKPRYDEVATASEAFLPDAVAALHEGKLQQIWLDHLLALSSQQADNWDTSLFVLAYPQRNIPCEKAVHAYQEHLTAYGRTTFVGKHLEDIHGAIADNTDARWVGDFHRRYLNFDRADAHLAS